MRLAGALCCGVLTLEVVVSGRTLHNPKVDLARFRLRRLRHRRLCPVYRRLENAQLGADRLCAGCVGAGPVAGDGRVR